MEIGINETRGSSKCDLLIQDGRGEQGGKSVENEDEIFLACSSYMAKIRRAWRGVPPPGAQIPHRFLRKAGSLL